jgi:hypothetical protein
MKALEFNQTVLKAHGTSHMTIVRIPNMARQIDGYES